MTITRPEIDEDFTLIFREKRYPISKCLFGLYSRRFRNSPQIGAEKEMVVEDDVGELSFQTFVSGCQGRFYRINDSNCFDLLKLCTSWEVESIKTEVKKHLDQIGNVESAILQLVNRPAEDGGELEGFVAQNMNRAMKCSAFVKLPTDVLLRILKETNKAELDHHLFLTKLLQLLERSDADVSCLFDFLDTAALTRDELQQLLSVPGIDQKSVRVSFAKTMDELFKRIDEQKEVVKEFASRPAQEGEQDKAFSKLSQKVKRLKSKVEKKLGVQDAPSGVHPDVAARIEELTKQLHTLNEEVEKYKQKFEDIQSQTDEMESIKDDVITQIATLQKSLEEQPLKTGRRKRTSEAGRDAAKSHHRTLSLKAPDNARIPLSQSNSALSRRAEVSSKQRQTVMVVQKDLPMALQHSVVVRPYTSNSFDGVFHFLTNQYSVNPCAEGFIAITASSSVGQDPSIVISSSASWAWKSQDKHHQWIQFDFKNMLLQATHYTIKAGPHKAGNEHPKTWALEVSDSQGDSTWKVIDQQNNSDLNGPNAYKTYPCQCDKPYQYYRIKATGPNHKGTSSLAIAKVEFFGTLSLARPK